MLVKTAGIAIRNTKYSDSSLISKIYTRKLGMKTYMVNGVRSPKAPIRPSLLQPLTLLELVVYNNPVKDIQRIREAQARPALHDLHFNVVKSAIGLFISELLQRTIKEEEANEALYDFVQGFIELLDGAGADLSLYPLRFVLELTQYLGFPPQNNYAHPEQSFDLAAGHFTEKAEAMHSVTPPHTEQLVRLLEAKGTEGLHLPKASRTYLLDKLMEYYALHLPGFGTLRSLPVVKAIMGGE